MKKTLVFILTLVLLINTFLVSVGASTDPLDEESGVTPRWTNCAMCDTVFGVANGVAELFIDYYADETLFTYATFEVTLEKRFLLAFWKDVDVWTMTTYEHSAYYATHIPVDGKGKYRATFHMEFYGNTGAVDVVEDVRTYDYEG